MAAEPAALYSPESPALRLVEATGVQESEDLLGYRFIPQSEDRNFDLGTLAQLPTAYLHGLGRAATHLFRYHFGDSSDPPWPYPQKQEFKVNGRVLEALITKANPELDLRPEQVTTHFIGLGLSEKPGIGSAYAWHMANATGFPGRNVVTLPEPGKRSLEETAAEDFVMMRQIAGDSPAKIVTNSVSTKRGFMVAHMNLLTRGELQMDVRGVKSFAPAMGARNVPEAERFSDANGDDMEFIQDETNKFFRHVPGNILHEVLADPEAGGVSTALLWAYAAAAALGKLPEQLAVLAGNVKSAQEGIDWEIMKHVATGNQVDVVAGADDPLWKAQKEQFLALRRHAPNTQIRELEGYGHVLTIDGPGMVQHMYEMEERDAA